MMTLEETQIEYEWKETKQFPVGIATTRRFVDFICFKGKYNVNAILHILPYGAFSGSKNYFYVYQTFFCKFTLRMYTA